jgi:hypothetical protein
LKGQRLFQLLLGQQAALDQNFTQFLSCSQFLSLVGIMLMIY